MRVISKGVLVSITLAGGSLYLLRALAGSIESMIVLLSIIAVLFDPIVSKKPDRLARALVITAILSSIAFSVPLAFAPLIVQVSALLILGLLIGGSLFVLIEKQEITPGDTRWLALLASVVAGIVSIAIVGLAFVGESIARALGIGVSEWFEPSRPWLSFFGPMLFYLGIALPQHRLLGSKDLVISSLVFVAFVAAVIVGVHMMGIA